MSSSTIEAVMDVCDCSEEDARELISETLEEIYAYIEEDEDGYDDSVVEDIWRSNTGLEMDYFVDAI